MTLFYLGNEVGGRSAGGAPPQPLALPVPVPPPRLAAPGAGISLPEGFLRQREQM